MSESEERAQRFFSTMGITDRSFKEVWASLHSEELKLFLVRNTTGYEKLFLAESGELALYLAVNDGHLRHVKNGQCRLVSDKFLKENRAFVSAVAKAIKEGMPGPVVRLSDDSAKVKDVSYTPLHSV